MAGALTTLYGWFLGPPLAGRDPLIKACASLGFALVLLGFMQWRWTPDARSLTLPTDDRSTSTTGCESTGRRRSA